MPTTLMPTDLRKDIRPHHRDFSDDKDERPRVARAKGVKALTLQRLWMVRRSRFSAATPGHTTLETLLRVAEKREQFLQACATRNAASALTLTITLPSSPNPNPRRLSRQATRRAAAASEFFLWRWARGALTCTLLVDIRLHQVGRCGKNTWSDCSTLLICATVL